MFYVRECVVCCVFIFDKFYRNDDTIEIGVSFFYVPWHAKRRIAQCTYKKEIARRKLCIVVLLYVMPRICRQEKAKIKET